MTWLLQGPSLLHYKNIVLTKYQEWLNGTWSYCDFNWFLFVSRLFSPSILNAEIRLHELMTDHKWIAMWAVAHFPPRNLCQISILFLKSKRYSHHGEDTGVQNMAFIMYDRHQRHNLDNLARWVCGLHPSCAQLSPIDPGKWSCLCWPTPQSEKNGITRVGIVVWDISLTIFQTVVQIFIS